MDLGRREIWKGSVMIGCFIAAGWSRDRDKTTPMIYTKSWLIQITTWSQQIRSLTTNILLIKIWIVSSVHCRITTDSCWQVSQSPSPLVAKMRAPLFCGRQGVWNRTTPDRRNLLGDDNVGHEFCLKAEFLGTLSFPTKTSPSYTAVIYQCFGIDFRA